MKKSNMLKLLEMIRDDEFISTNINALFSGKKSVDFSLFLDLSDEWIDEIINQNDSKLKFLLLYSYLNASNGTLNLSGKIDYEIILNVILEKNVMSSIRNCGFVYAVANASGNEQARCACKLLNNVKFMKHSNALSLFKCVAMARSGKHANYATDVLWYANARLLEFKDLNSVIYHIANASGEGQAACAKTFILNSNLSDYRVALEIVKIISNAHGGRQAECACELALKYKNKSCVLRIVQMAADANGDEQLKYAMSYLDNQKTFRRDEDGKFHDDLERASILASAKGGVQAARAHDLFFAIKTLDRKFVTDLMGLISLADADYKAGYAKLVAEKLAVLKGKESLYYIGLIINAVGPVQTECASYLAVDENILSHPDGIEIIESVANAVGEYQAESAYLIAKNPNLLKLDNILEIIDSIVFNTSKTEVLRIRNLVSDYEVLPITATLKNVSEKCENEVSVKDVMGINDIDLLIEAIGSLDMDSIDKKAKVDVKKLVRDIRKQRKKG